MLVLVPEQYAISDILVGLDLPSLMQFLANAQLPQIGQFSSDMRPIPVVVLDLLAWLEKNEDALPGLLQTLINDFPQHTAIPVIRDIHARVAHHLHRATISPWTASLISGVIVVNRSTLRSVLSALIRGTGALVTMIDGLPRTGRSHSWYLINHVARQTTRAFPVKMDLIAVALEKNTLEATAERLARKLRITFKPSSTIGLTPETLGANFAEDMIDAWNNREEHDIVWLVFDSLDRMLAPEIRSFICAMVCKVLNHETHNMVIFLLGAGPTFGVSDSNAVVQKENLTVFLDHEITQTASALNALGQSPLSPADLANRIQAMHALLSTGDPGEVCTSIGRKLSELRLEVLA